MADQFWASPEELDKLGATKDAAPSSYPASEVPDPEPEVLERAQQILDGLTAGEAFSTQTTKPAEPELSEEERLRFVAHIMDGKPYTADYSLLGGRLVLSFKSIDAELEGQITKLVLGQEAQQAGTPADRNARYTNYLMLCSLASMTCNGQTTMPSKIGMSIKPAQLAESYTEWATKTNRAQYRLILDSFNDFDRRMQVMLEKANDPSFWPTR